MSKSIARGLSHAAFACALAACWGDAPVSAAPETAGIRTVASARVVVPSTLEPLESAPAQVDLFDAHNAFVSSIGSAAVWESSNASVASVTGGTIVGHLPGDATITASTNGVSASAVVHVAWLPDTRLVIGSAPISLAPGDQLRFAPTARRSVPVGDALWTSSNPRVVRMDAPGSFTALVPGGATIVARFAGLVDSVTVGVVVGDVGFGYFYSADAEGSDYDDTYWAPAPGKGYSTAAYVSAILEPPYSTKPDFGWIGPAVPRRDAMMHAVSLENVACTVYAQPDSGFHFVNPGAPLVDCNRPFSTFRQSARLELLAFRPGEFTGTLALLRPGLAPFTTTVGGISESSPTRTARDYALPGVARDSLFWFVTPAASGVAVCGIAPGDAIPAQSAVRVACTSESWGPKDPSFYAVGFGADARHGTAPIGFVQVSGEGVVARKAVNGLDITTTAGSVPGSVDVEVSGARMSAFERIPAVLITAISTDPSWCGITEPVRATATRVTLRATCSGASGFVLGVMY